MSNCICKYFSLKREAIPYFFLLLFVHAALLFYFHDKFWLPQDDGVFTHIADRMVQGEIIHKDIEELHPGYNNFVNAFALKVFGRNFVSVRYPLILAAFIQSIFLFIFFSKQKSYIFAFMGALFPTTLGVLHFLNPNHHWYCLFFVIMLIVWLDCIPLERKRRYFVAGFLIATIFLFRQLSGFFVALGTIVYLFLEVSFTQTSKKSILPNILMAGLLLITSWLLLKTVVFSSFILFGIWPLAILLYCLKNVSLSRTTFIRITGLLLAGGVAGFLPLLIFHTVHGSLFIWFHDSFIRAMTVTKQPFLNELRFTDYIWDGLKVLLHPQRPGDVFNGLYWLAVFFLPFAVGTKTFLKVCFQEKKLIKTLLFPIIALFYGLVSTHNPIAVYGYFTIGLLASALLALSYKRKLVLGGVVSILVYLNIVALTCHAAQPLLVRTFSETIRGIRIPYAYAGDQLKYINLWFPQGYIDIYKKLITTIERESLSNDSIFVFPNNAEVYFLANRKNPFRFFSVDHGIQTDEEYDRVMRIFEQFPPKVVIYNPFDKRNTHYSRKLIQNLKEKYTLIDKVAVFEMYKISY